MTNTTKSFPSTVNYVPGEQLDGTLQLSGDELAPVVAAFWLLVMADGSAVTFYTRELSFLEYPRFELVFSAGSESVEAVADALAEVIATFDVG